MWFNLVILAISVAISILMQPKTPEAKPASLSELDIPQIEMGKPHKIIFGTVMITDPTIVWYGDFGTKKVKTSSGK